MVESNLFKITLAAPGNDPKINGLYFLGLGERPNNRFKRLVFSQYKALFALRKINADIWHIHDPELLLFASILLLFRKKVIWDSHEDYFKQFELNSEYRLYIPKIIRSFASLLIIKLLKYVDLHATGIIGATEIIQSRYSNKNSVVVGNEARVEDFINLNPNFENMKVLFVGSMSDTHCFSEVVKAISRIQNLSLIVAGQEDENLLNWSTEILGNRITHFGWANRSKIYELISMSTIGIVTYQNLPTYNESRPTKMFEFLMSGLPIVASPIMPNVQILQASSGGIVSGGYNSKDFEKSLMQVISSKEIWTSMSVNGRKWAQENASWAPSERNLINLYKKFLIHDV